MLDVKNSHGFCADPCAPAWLNVNNYYRQMSRTEYEGRLANATCHNLCKKTRLPVGTRSLLSKGLKFCPTRSRPTNNTKKTMKRFKRDIRRIAYHYYNPPKKKPGVRYIPGLYISQNGMLPNIIPRPKSAWMISSGTTGAAASATNRPRRSLRRG